VGVPATPGVMGERGREKSGKPLDDCDTCVSTGTLAVNRSGRAGLKEGAVEAVGELSKQGRPSTDVTSIAFGRK
jgi:hypothetical protein